MRAGLAVMMVLGIAIPVLARAQADADVEPAILLHPRVRTILYFPDEIVHTWIVHDGEIRVARVGNELYMRPRPGTPAGVEATLEVETLTMHRTFRLRVVARAGKASVDVVVPPDTKTSLPVPAAMLHATLVTPPRLGPPPAPDAPATSAPPPAPPELADDRERAEPTEPLTPERLTLLRAPRWELSVHAVGSLGFMALDIAGSQPSSTRQPYAGAGARLVVTRPNAWWALEASLGGDWPGGPISVRENSEARPRIDIEGPWLRAELGARAQLGSSTWNPSALAALGVQAQLRRTERHDSTRWTSETMPQGAVLVLGIGLQRRAGSLLLGLDFQVRQGWPDGYHSMAVLGTAGWVLDPGQEDEP